ncbi:MAG: hypothetical protein JSV27_03855 [Candidatus Bathyarchaeota archaeon]|nr:MAG: hypothetical protein JSV27_03855 [Candidatus Bathyarchaeota archaeon]
MRTNTVGYYSQKFKGDGWSVIVSNAVVWKPVYEMEVEYSGEVSFNWAGTVDQHSVITENE